MNSIVRAQQNMIVKAVSGMLILLACACTAAPVPAIPNTPTAVALLPTATPPAATATIVPATAVPNTPAPTATQVPPTATMAPIPTATATAVPAPPTPTAVPPTATANTAQITQGRTVYTRQACSVCHGDQGQGVSAPALAGTRMTLEQVRQQIRNPKGEMPAYTAAQLSDSDIAAIYAFLQSLKP